ncbi:Crp/Fnr family transcriptional regulator [Pseudochryseolinea flava]|uniref:Crp/Fnr family transcriptional regulator n=1 Tax=Pseudochryseolinea flava TaxID=2059302 RepID=A0A364Y945_9BACT|nr:Crp/Fnr family transcriptional regulator [Pseudochryseolinea flava]RAW02889.1 Crp/Fnr family transcriptional regulator [Pseudochryseolinea flava]
MNSALVRALHMLTHLPPEEESKLLSITHVVAINKGEPFIREGTVPQKFAFVNRGLFRYYYSNEKGTEFTKGFFAENSFIVSYTAMSKQLPSHYSIEALEDAEIMVIDYAEWLKLFRAHPCWTKFLLSLIEKGYMKKEARERELLILNASERYRIFLRDYPQLEHRVKQHQIASYLGITPVALSRIRKEMTL